MASDIESVGNAKIVSCITYKNDIISFGQNFLKTHPFQKKYSRNSNSIFLHAEVCAIKNIYKKIDIEDFKKCSIFVCRVKKTKPRGSYISGLCRPCLGCYRAISTFEFKNCYYTEENKEGFRCL